MEMEQSHEHEQLSDAVDDIVAIFSKKVEGSTRLSYSDCEYLCKVIRLISNLSLDRNIGMRLAEMLDMELMIHLAANSDLQTNTELLLNSVGCLANLSYYFDSNNGLFHCLQDCHQLFPQLLMNDNTEIVVQTCRILANMTRPITLNTQWIEKSSGTSILSQCSGY